MSPEEFLIQNATNIDISRKNDSAMIKSRSGEVRVSKNLTNPYIITVNVHNGLDYETMYPKLATMLVNSTGYKTNFRIGNTSGSAYLTSYQGDLTSAEIANITINSTLGNKIWIDTTSTTGSGNIFKTGDYIQPKGNTLTYQHPYTVTSDVAWASGNVEVPVHRGIINQPNVSLATSGVAVGNNVFFAVKHKDLLSYTLTPNEKIEFKEFTFIESIQSI